MFPANYMQTTQLCSRLTRESTESDILNAALVTSACHTGSGTWGEEFYLYWKGAWFEPRGYSCSRHTQIIDEPFYLCCGRTQFESQTRLSRLKLCSLGEVHTRQQQNISTFSPSLRSCFISRTLTFRFIPHSLGMNQLKIKYSCCFCKKMGGKHIVATGRPGENLGFHALPWHDFRLSQRWLQREPSFYVTLVTDLFFLWLILNPENGGSMFLQNIGWPSTD
jgi:hypothetical protein